MKIYLGQIKANDKFHAKDSDFVDSEFVKTCDELVIGPVVTMFVQITQTSNLIRLSCTQFRF